MRHGANFGKEQESIACEQEFVVLKRSLISTVPVFALRCIFGSKAPYLHTISLRCFFASCFSKQLSWRSPNVPCYVRRTVPPLALMLLWLMPVVGRIYCCGSAEPHFRRPSHSGVWTCSSCCPLETCWILPSFRVDLGHHYFPFGNELHSQCGYLASILLARSLFPPELHDNACWGARHDSQEISYRVQIFVPFPSWNTASAWSLEAHHCHVMHCNIHRSGFGHRYLFFRGLVLPKQPVPYSFLAN